MAESVGRAGVLLATGLWLAAGSACSPQRYREQSPLRTLARIGAIDFAPDASRRRLDGLLRPVRGLGGELQRVQHLAPLDEHDLAHEARRSEHAAADVAAAVAHEFGRARDLGRVFLPLPSPDRWSVVFAEDLASLGVVLGLDRRPLGEPDDREHRTSPDDERPEKSWWQRLQRRLFP